MHWFHHLHTVFYGSLCRLNEASFRLIVSYLTLFLTKFVELLDGHALRLDSFLPYLKLIISLLLLSLPILLLLLDPKYLHQGKSTYASSGIENGL